MREKSLIFRGFRACVSSGFRQATLEPRGGVWGPEQAPKVLQLLLPRRGTSSPAPRRSPTWPAERGAGLCIPPSTSSPRRPGARRTGAVKGETGSRTRSAAAGEHRTGECFSAAALDRRSPAGGHHDDESRREVVVGCGPARSGFSAPAPAHHGSDPHPELSRAKVPRIGRQARQAERAAPARRGGVRD